MLKSIIRKEILNNLLSYKFSIITILSTILILVSIFVMYRDYCLARENYELLLPKSGKDYVIIPPTPLSIFAKGLDENLCRSYGGGSARIEVSRKQQSVNDVFKLFTAPDLLYVIKVILSLCAMLFAFDIVSGEKETGTLRQTISNTVKRPILIIGKWAGGFISFILPFFMAVLRHNFRDLITYGGYERPRLGKAGAVSIKQCNLFIRFLFSGTIDFVPYTSFFYIFGHFFVCLDYSCIYHPESW